MKEPPLSHVKHDGQNAASPVVYMAHSPPECTDLSAATVEIGVNGQKPSIILPALTAHEAFCDFAEKLRKRFPTLINPCDIEEEVVEKVEPSVSP